MLWYEPSAHDVSGGMVSEDEASGSFEPTGDGDEILILLSKPRKPRSQARTSWNETTRSAFETYGSYAFAKR
jgi:hypothetical protein